MCEADPAENSSDREETALQSDSPHAEKRSGVWAIVETTFIFLIFFLYAGAPAPDVNEAHYLAKAKHYWNPAWGAGDLFLESRDAHLVFNWTLGWLTLWLPLPAVAWAGRIVTWLLLAIAWQRLSFALVPRNFFAILSSAILLLLIQRFHLAGEWVVGGVEAKGFSFVCVFLGLESLVRSRWRSAILLMGLATLFHVLVGGWSLVAVLYTLLVGGVPCRPRFWVLSGYGLLAALIAAPSLAAGLSLSWGADSATVAEANRIYVFERLSHHLAPHTFASSAIVLPFATAEATSSELVIPSWFICRHLMLILGWLLLAGWMRREAHQQTLQTFVAGALLVAAMGAGIDFLSIHQPTIGAALLKYYWFRLSDIAIPLGFCFALLGLLVRLESKRESLAQWLLVVVIFAAAANLVQVLVDRSQDTRPLADRQSMAVLGGDRRQMEQRYGDWLRACAWVQENTTEESQFITPHFQQTFKWHTGRPEIANWKDVPQDAESLIVWWKRYRQLYPLNVRVFGLAAHSDKRLHELAHQFDATFVLVDQTRHRRSLNRKRFTRVYPNQMQPNETYAVYWVRPQK